MHLKAKIAGGAEMFAAIQKTQESIGFKNVEAVKQKLQKLDIAILSEEIGGHVGRSVKFSLETGVIEINKRM